MPKAKDNNIFNTRRRVSGVYKLQSSVRFSIEHGGRDIDQSGFPALGHDAFPSSGSRLGDPCKRYTKHMSLIEVQIVALATTTLKSEAIVNSV